MAETAVGSTTNQPRAAQTSGGAAAALQAAQELKKMLMGPAKGNMNLAGVSARAAALRKSVDQIIGGLQYNAHNVHWDDTLDKYAVLNVQFYSLLQQLRPLMKHYVVHPKSVNQQNAAVLPIMLSTKLLPEMEEREAAMLQEHKEKVGSMKENDQYEMLLASVEDFNKLIEYVTTLTVEGSGILDARHPLQKELNATARGASAPSAATLKRQTSLRGSRKQQLEGPDLLLAAVSTGQGLRP